jgi:hypothetical protein
MTAPRRRSGFDPYDPGGHLRHSVNPLMFLIVVLGFIPAGAAVFFVVAWVLPMMLLGMALLWPFMAVIEAREKRASHALRNVTQRDNDEDEYASERATVVSVWCHCGWSHAFYAPAGVRHGNPYDAAAAAHRQHKAVAA